MNAESVDIVTSYYSNIKKVEAAGYTPVAISLSIPEWVQDAYPDMYWYFHLTPTWDMVDLKDDKAEFRQKYDVILSKLVPARVIKEICEATGSNKTALMCWESPEKFCHRHLVARWFISAGIAVREYNTKAVLQGFGIS